MERQVRDQPLESLRYERKFLVDRMDDHQIRAMVRLHPAMFVMPYPPRWVNNIYLDTPDLANYQDNVEGAVDRRKVRLRWYHGLFEQTSQATLEFKIKHGMVGRKVQYPLGKFQLMQGFSRESLQDYLQSADLPEGVKFLIRDQIPVLVNRYKRWYFATTDGRFRVTVDTALQFYTVHLLNNSFRFRHEDQTLKVVELKYQKKDDLAAGQVSSHFPFSVYKNSKYVLGMDNVYW
jgi:SPX domain protein involved in polyphosphate accumulation